MSSDHEHDETIEEPEEEEVVLRPEDQQVPITGYADNPIIRRILRNPRVLEVHIRFKIKGNGYRQPYVCIIFTDGSSIERPLADVEENEEPICPPVNSIEPIPMTNRIEPVRRQQQGTSRWRSMNPFTWIMSNRNGTVKRMTKESMRRDGNCVIVTKKSITKFCDDSDTHTDYDPNCPTCRRHRRTNHGRVNMRNRGDDCWSSNGFD